MSLYPAQAATFDAAYLAELAGIPDQPKNARKEGVRWGEKVAAKILLARASDGSTNVVPYTPGSGPGAWIPTPRPPATPGGPELPGLPSLLPNWPSVTPFAMTSGSQFRPPGQPALSSSNWAAEFNQTKELGSKTSATRSAEQTDIARFWADGAGTVTPPGHWNVIARDVAAQRGTTLEQNARLFALLNIAVADAAICSWDAKYAYNFWRPITAIRMADTDGNNDTEADSAWTPLLVTPNFPEYTSGHSTFSSAGAAILGGFFGSDAVAFTTLSDDLPGVSRSFNSFSAAAMEAGLSRIYGGIHFMSGNLDGLNAGHQVGQFVLQNFLRPKHEPKSKHGHSQDDRDKSGE